MFTPRLLGYGKYFGSSQEDINQRGSSSFGDRPNYRDYHSWGRPVFSVGAFFVVTYAALRILSFQQPAIVHSLQVHRVYAMLV